MTASHIYDILRRVSPRQKASGPDFLDEIVADRAAATPAFPLIVENLARFSELVAELVERRRSAKLSQADVAGAMDTTQSAIARIESGEANLSINTLSRYAATLGYHLEIGLSATEPETVRRPA